MKIDTRCMECYKEFPEGELKLCNNGLDNAYWGCPHCESHNIEVILELVAERTPFKYNDVKPKYEEGNGHD